MSDLQSDAKREDSDFRILVELKQRRGEEDVALNPSQIAEKSAEALDNAMKAIYGMSRKVAETLKDIPLVERPTAAEVEFGLKLTSDANTLIVNTGLEAQITVKLSWTREEKKTDKNSTSQG